MYCIYGYISFCLRISSVLQHNTNPHWTKSGTYANYYTRLSSNLKNEVTVALCLNQQMSCKYGWNRNRSQSTVRKRKFFTDAVFRWLEADSL